MDNIQFSNAMTDGYVSMCVLFSHFRKRNQIPKKGTAEPTSPNEMDHAIWITLKPLGSTILYTLPSLNKTNYLFKI